MSSSSDEETEAAKNEQPLLKRRRLTEEQNNNNNLDEIMGTSSQFKISDDATPNDKSTSYLPPVEHRWRFPNPFCVKNYDRIKVPTDPMQSIQLNYGPFSIGETRWQLEFRVPEFGVYLKRVNGGGGGGNNQNDDQELSFLFFSNFKLFWVRHKFVFNAENQEMCIAQFDSGICKSSELEFNFHAFVRPENYARGSPCDFRIVVFNPEGKQIAEFAAHRSVLSEKSPVFKAMLAPDSKFKEAKEGVLRIGNFSHKTIRSLLHFIYTGQVLTQGKTYSEAMELVDCAEQYQVKETLKNECGVFLLSLIDRENAVELLTLAQRYQLGALKKGAMEHIRNDRVRIIGPGQNDEELKRLPPETLVEMLRVFSQE